MMVRWFPSIKKVWILNLHLSYIHLCFCFVFKIRAFTAVYITVNTGQLVICSLCNVAVSFVDCYLAICVNEMSGLWLLCSINFVVLI